MNKKEALPGVGPEESVTAATNWFSRHPKKTLAALLLLLVLMCTALAEIILAYQNRGYHPGLQRYIRLREYRPFFSQKLVPPEVEWRIADNLARQPYSLRIDADGFIMPSRIHARPDRSLVFLGGSSTACGYMGEEERFPYLTGRLLQERTGLKINSLNSGVGGNNSLHSLNILYNKIIPLKPNVAIFCHNINDLTTLLLEGSYWSDNPSRSNLVTVNPTLGGSLKEIRDQLIPHLSREVSQLTRQLKAKFRRSSRPTPQEDEFARVRDRRLQVDEARLRQAFRNNLQLFIRICRLHGIEPVLMTQASRLKDSPDPVIKSSLQDLEQRQGLPYGDYKRLFEAFNEEIRAVGAAQGVLVIDLAAQIPPEKEYLYDIVHFTAQGSRRAAEIIAQALLTRFPDMFSGENGR